MFPVHCSSCGFPLPNTDAGPCPECGGVTKTVELTARATVMGTARAMLRVDTPGLLLQTVILRGERTSEGTLIETVTLPWFEIADGRPVPQPAADFADVREWAGSPRTEAENAGVNKSAGSRIGRPLIWSDAIAEAAATSSQKRIFSMGSKVWSSGP
jgi:hypothetical protein